MRVGGDGICASQHEPDGIDEDLLVVLNLLSKLQAMTMPFLSHEGQSRAKYNATSIWQGIWWNRPLAWTRSHAKLGQRFCKFSNRARYQTIGDTILHLVPCALSSSRGPTGTRQTSSDGRLLKDGFRRAISDGCLPTDSLRLRRTDGSLRTGCSAVCLRAGGAPSRMSLPKRTLVKPPRCPFQKVAPE